MNSFECLLKASELGHPRAQHKLATAYSTGYIYILFYLNTLHSLLYIENNNKKHLNNCTPIILLPHSLQTSFTSHLSYHHSIYSSLVPIDQGRAIILENFAALAGNPEVIWIFIFIYFYFFILFFSLYFYFFSLPKAHMGMGYRYLKGIGVKVKVFLFLFLWFDFVYHIYIPSFLCK